MALLNTFPLSFKVRDKRIAIIGGGEEALNKVRLVAKTSAQIVIISRQIEADFSGFAVQCIERGFAVSDLDGVALVFVAEESADAALAKAEARARNIPLNVVDVPAECDFYTPSIVDRAPLTVAISTEGDAPVLARLVRARIEAMLPPGFGKIASLSGGLRQRVESLIHTGPARRRYYEALVTSPQVEAAVAQGPIAGRFQAEVLLEQHQSNSEATGIVWLIGAGPGSEDLLTLRAQRLLQEADVIVHDQLVPDAVVQMGRRDAEQISVGKAKGHHSFSQAQINMLITLRKVSSGFVMATAHGAEDSDLTHWAGLAQSGLTLALYMGKSIAAEVAGRLVAHGANPELPVGIVVNAGRPQMTTYAASLRSLIDSDVVLADGPAIIFVGEAVAAGDWSNAAQIAAQNFKVA